MADKKEENNIINSLLPIFLTGVVSVGGTSAFHLSGEKENIVNSSTIESCAEFIYHGKNHQRLDDGLIILEKDIGNLKKDIINEIKILILEKENNKTKG